MKKIMDSPIPVDSEFHLAPSASVPGPTDDFWYQPIGSANSTGIRVTPESSLRVAAVMACVRVLSETIACLPLFVYRQLSDGGKERATDHPLYNLLHTRRGTPNRWQTAVEFREMLQAHLLLRGNAYAEIIPGRLGAVSELIPLHPDRVTPEQLANRRLKYTIRNPFDGNERTLNQDQVFHIRGISSDGITGINPIDHASESIGLAVATEAHGGSLFRNGARPGVVLEMDGKLPQGAAGQIRSDWESLHRGPYKAHRTAVLEHGLKAHELGMTNENAQFLETRKFQILEICRIFRVQPHMIFDLERATFSNIEHQSIEFVQYGLVPWLTRWEAAISRSLIADDDEYFAEHVVDGLLRGDTASRFAAYATARQWGWLSINEIRTKENLNPIEDGDDHLQPMNMVPVGEEPEQAEQQPEPAPSRDDGQQRETLVMDAAQRIVNAESREIDKRITKAAEDRQRFDAWLTEFYRKHLSYVEKTVAPLVETFGGERADCIAEWIVARGTNLLVCANVAEAYDTWKIERLTEVSEQIKKGLNA